MENEEILFLRLELPNASLVSRILDPNVESRYKDILKGNKITLEVYIAEKAKHRLDQSSHYIIFRENMTDVTSDSINCNDYSIRLVSYMSDYYNHKTSVKVKYFDNNNVDITLTDLIFHLDSYSKKLEKQCILNYDKGLFILESNKVIVNNQYNLNYVIKDENNNVIYTW